MLLAGNVLWNVGIFFCRADTMRDVVGTRLVQIGDDDPGAGLRERVDDRRADPVPSAGDDRVPAFQRKAAHSLALVAPEVRFLFKTLRAAAAMKGAAISKA